MQLKKLFWSLAKKILRNYTQKNKVISRCYIRHSASFAPQNPFLSDLDLAFFVNASNIDQLRDIYEQIKVDFKKTKLLQIFTRDFILLPAAKNAYHSCEGSYPFRSKYPFETWLPVESGAASARVDLKVSLPLDHVPENCLLTHLIPSLTQRKAKRIFEHAFLSRKLNDDCLWVKGENNAKKFRSIYEALLIEIDIWDGFYKKIDFIGKGAAVPCRLGRCNDKSLMDSFKKAASDLNCKEVISSLWVNPASHNDHIANVSLNIKPSISPKECQMTIESILKAFKGLKYTLFIGTEDSMIARINALRGHFLIDPWLLKHQGFCLLGDPGVKERIIEPSMKILKTKYREFLFNFMLSTRFLSGDPYPYAIYRLCFTMDHLFKHHELILIQEDLLAIYGRGFISQKQFDPGKHTPQLLLSLKEMHDFDLFKN